MSEGSRHFEESSAVQLALRKIARRLGELGIPYAVAGGMALFAHGLRRFTEDVDVLVTSEGLKAIHHELEGAGYLPPFFGSRNLRDVDSGVRIEFLVAGQFPGDGKPKPVAFPAPAPVSVELSGIRYLNIPTLIELKLASGMTSPSRFKDLADVQELINSSFCPPISRRVSVRMCARALPKSGPHPKRRRSVSCGCGETISLRQTRSLSKR